MSTFWSVIEVLAVASAMWFGAWRPGRKGAAPVWKRVGLAAVCGIAAFAAVEFLMVLPRTVSIPVIAMAALLWLREAANREKVCRRMAGAAGATAKWSARQAERAAKAGGPAPVAAIVPDTTGLDGNTSIARAWLLLHQ